MIYCMNDDIQYMFCVQPCYGGMHWAETEVINVGSGEQ